MREPEDWDEREVETPTSFLFPYILGLTAEFWGHRRHRFYFSLFMKKFLISLVMLLNLSVAGLFAQGSLIATLSHGDSIAMYYGSYALRDALNAAESGDVISLSGGSFAAVDINKAVSIRGQFLLLQSVKTVGGPAKLRFDAKYKACDLRIRVIKGGGVITHLDSPAL